MIANFSVDPALIARLGQELISRKEIAVCELIKNSYDADAKIVTVYFKNTLSKEGEITVIDSGNGMSQDELVNNFMRLGTSNKVKNDVSPVLKRRVSGQKGLGRIAAQRLGSNLEVISKKLNYEGVSLKIDWKRFYEMKTVEEVKFEVASTNKRLTQGTEIKISALEDTWSKEDIQKIYPYFKTILDIKPSDEFAVECYYQEGEQQEKITINELNITPYAVANIATTIDHHGTVSYTFTGGKGLKFEAKGHLETKYIHLSGISLSAQYFIFLGKYIPARLLTEVGEQVDRYPGIKIYRKGVRVLPYGEPGDDWIGLDASDSSRDYLFPHKNRNFSGVIRIEGESTAHLKESASRDGLIINNDFDDLSTVIYNILTTCGHKVAEIRNRQSTRGKSKPKDPLKVLQDAVSNLNKLSTSFTNEDKETVKKQLVEISDSLNQSTSVMKANIEELSMIRVLATLGLSLGEFVHEMQHYLIQMESGLEKIETILKGRNVLALIDLRNGINSFKSFLGYFSKVISRNIDRKIEIGLDIRFYIRDFITAISNSLRESHITLEGPIYSQNILMPVPIHYSEWYSILFNFYTNSLKAIKKAGKKGKIRIEAGKSVGGIFIRFEDNGFGIDKENEDKIFDPFYTTYLYDSVQPSTGLGLHIVKQIINSYGGSISLEQPSEGYKTCLYVTFPPSK